MSLFRIGVSLPIRKLTPHTDKLFDIQQYPIPKRQNCRNKIIFCVLYLNIFIFKMCIFKYTLLQFRCRIFLFLQYFSLCVENILRINQLRTSQCQETSLRWIHLQSDLFLENSYLGHSKTFQTIFFTHSENFHIKSIELFLCKNNLFWFWK